MEDFEDSTTPINPLKDASALNDFNVTAVLKRDVFSETRVGYFTGDPETRIVRRIVTASPWWSRPLAWILAKREIRALHNIRGLTGVPQLIAIDKHGLFRSWSEGTPLHLARPDTKHFYKTGHKILRDLRRIGVTHNDLAKPQNWLMTPEGDASLIDFQLASFHKRRGAFYRYLAYEDFRHLIKQKRSFAPDLMTPTEWRILRKRSWPSALWLATGKKVYNFVTKGLFNWSDGEGTGDRLQSQGPEIRAVLADNPDIKDVAISVYSLPAKGVGLYVFAETDNLDEKQIRNLLRGQKVEAVQPVATLPRSETGEIRDDILRLIAMNELGELDDMLIREPQLRDIIQPILDERKNFTDRRVYEFEKERSES
ncbi:serine/threonine protein kinase [Bartonella sp. HY329]|uniref:serine/threonine protein kinase n=1 Tax=unclassified Bartonella TaxID=2645622 RepID=UPI0021CA18F5|nr:MULTISPECIES: serine/threonine protein kinase [unclassified Bartonella]UXM94534.1 serine/threonine protein kinase [Bartonella sp. HY329]UXN08858.1 serine/threonine protein kinase [Bartonella sp. HY328]